MGRLWVGDVRLTAHKRLQGMSALALLFSSADQCTDLELHASAAGSQQTVPASASLSLLGLVDPSLIPLHLILGPALEVYSNSEGTVAWILNHLLVEGSCTAPSLSPVNLRPWQSEVGVLLRVENGMRSQHEAFEATELLLYAATAGPCAAPTAAPPTPPRSSSPAPPYDETLRVGDLLASRLKVFALPLSSAIQRQLTTLPEPPTPPPETAGQDDVGCFLSLPAGAAETRKRDRLDSLFDDATRQIKRARRHGGETVAKLMASLDKPARPASSSGSGPATPHDAARPDTLPPKRPRLERVAPLARSQSVSALQELSSTQPSGRSDSLPQSRRIGLSRVATTGQLNSLAPVSPALGVEAENKNALSRIVMAGMRMYGLSQRKRDGRSRAGSALPTPTGAESAPAPATARGEDEDEYKVVYHQTFKAAAFAVRRQISVKPLSQEILRDVVDRLLVMFCTNLFEDGPLEGGLDRDLEGLPDVAFDLPSQEAFLINDCSSTTRQPVDSG